MLNFWNKSAPASKSSNDESERRALPASWYRSESMYELERRAIFSKKWIFVTHAMRFKEPGDYVSIEEAGFSFFLVKDRDENINGFHNICRHRAYPVVEKSAGNAFVLSCKYHGWSYGLKGNLAKAPRFDTVPSFDKTQHGLLPVAVHIDAKGFIWVNLDASASGPEAWANDFDGIDTQERIKDFDLHKDYHFDHQWGMDGDYNWKTLADNYNECYHCPTGHPLVAAVADLSQYRVETTGGQIIHYNTNKDEEDDVYRLASQFLFPNASFTLTSNFFFIQRCIPVSASKTRMEYEVYRHNDATDEDFNAIDQFYKQVMGEDKELCNGAQKNLNAGVFVNGQLHPEKEKGPLFFQQTVRRLVMEHRSKEESENDGKPIWPAMRVPESSGRGADKLSEEEVFCSKLETSMGCMAGQTTDGGILAW